MKANETPIRVINRITAGYEPFAVLGTGWAAFKWCLMGDTVAHPTHPGYKLNLNLSTDWKSDWIAVHMC